MSFVQTPYWQLCAVSACSGAADGALLPAVRLCWFYNSTNQMAGHIQLQPIFRDISNTRPSHGRRNFRELWLRAVFCVTAGVRVLFNISIHGTACDGLAIE